MRRPVVFAILIFSASALAVTTASAAPIATLSEDVDGDGARDAIELDATGTLRVRAGAAAAAAVPVSVGTPGGAVLTTGSRLRAGRPQGVPTIVAELATAEAREAVVVQYSRGAWRVVTRSPIGGIGLDEEYAYAIDLTGTAVVRYQTKPELRRCDGAPAYLFAEQLVNGAFVRRVRPPVALPATTPLLIARIDPAPSPVAPLIFRARGASTEAGATDAGALAAPTELDDGKLTTSWRETIADSDGTTEFFTFLAGMADARPVELRIVPGRRLASRQPNRPHELVVSTAHEAWRVALPDPIAGAGPGDTAYVVELPTTSADPCVTVTLASTYGPPTGETAIAELGIYAEGERAGGGDTLLAALVSKGGSGADTAAGRLSKRGASATTAIEAELQRTTDARARVRLVGALARVNDPSATPGLVAAVQAGWVGGSEVADIVRALASRGAITALEELVRSKRLTTELRVVAVGGITPTGGGIGALVKLAGRGPTLLRRAVIDQLRLAPVASLMGAAAAQPDPRAAGDLYRAATRRAHAHATEAPGVVTAMLAALPLATDYERRYRLIDGIAAHGDATALRTVSEYVRALPVGAEATALRQVAVRALAQTPRADAAPFVLDAIADVDPGVRLAALFVIASADPETSDAGGPWHLPDGPAAVDRVIVNALADHWPEVRRRAAASLGPRCSRPGPAAALADRVAHDDSLDVRRDSLTALVQCHAAGIAALLAATWDDAHLPTELRAHAVALAITLGDPTLGAALVARFTRWRGEAIESSGALALAQSAAAAIGRLAPPGAAAVLLEALDDTAFPEIVTSAALALGSLGSACPPAAKAKLTALSHSEPRAAAAAAHAAALCGPSSGLSSRP